MFRKHMDDYGAIALTTALNQSKRLIGDLRTGEYCRCAGQLRLPFQECGEPLQAFWQARFYDFNVYTKKKKAEKLNYMHRNPVTRRLVEHPNDWPWSSWEFYRGKKIGLLQIDVGD